MFSKVAAFWPKSSWWPPMGYTSLEMFLSQLANELFTDDLNELLQK